MDTAQTILSFTPPPIARYVDEVPDLLQNTIRKMLAKDPDGRYQTTKSLTTDLRQLSLGTMIESQISVAADSGTEEPKGVWNWMKRFWRKDSN